MKPLKSAHLKITQFTTVKTLITLIVSALLITGCASFDYPAADRSELGNSSRITTCKADDTLVQSSAQCLQDDAACYQLSNGQWCTGERGISCPAGSVALPEGTSCPIGARCFRISESLECTIS